MEQNEPLETWDTLIPLLHSNRAGWLNSLEQIKGWYPDEDIRASMKDVFSLLDQLLWQVTVAEEMRSRPELHALRPMLGHAIIRLPYREAEVWVKAAAANRFTVERVIC